MFFERTIYLFHAVAIHFMYHLKFSVTIEKKNCSGLQHIYKSKKSERNKKETTSAIEYLCAFVSFETF